MKTQRKIPLKRKNKRNYNKDSRFNIGRVLILVSLSLLAVGAFLLVRYAINTASANKLQQEMKEVFSAEAQQQMPTAHLLPDSASPANSTRTAPPPATTKPIENDSAAKPSPVPGMGAQFIGLYSKNSDLIGWLKAEAVPQIDFPVVKRDNIHYLDRDFYGRKQQSGTVFLDESLSILPRSTNLILHGHNMKNGTMFGKLYHYLEPEVTFSNPVFEFGTLYESSLYVPYAVSIVSLDPQSSKHVSLVHGEFTSQADMTFYADELIKFSKLKLPVDVAAEDKLLTLITCHGNEEHERLVVALRQVRPDENTNLIREEFSKRLK